MSSLFRLLSRFRSTSPAQRTGRSALGGLIAVLLLLAAPSARANLSFEDSDVIYAAIAAVVLGPPLLLALFVKRLRGVLPLLATLVVWVGVLTVGFQLLRALG